MGGIAARLVAVLAAAAFLVFPGFGLIDLTVTWDADWPQVLEAGWGVCFTGLVAIPLLGVALVPRRVLAAQHELLVVAAALAVGAIAGHQPGALWFAAGVAGSAALAVAAGGRRRPAVSLSPALLVLALAAAWPATAYAVSMFAASREARPDSDITVGVDHFAVQGSFALAAVALVALAGGMRTGRMLLGITAGASVAYVGLVSFAWPGTAAGWGQLASILTMGWGTAVVAAAVVDRGAASPSLGKSGRGRESVGA
jgi:hypothetical protein